MYDRWRQSHMKFEQLILGTLLLTTIIGCRNDLTTGTEAVEIKSFSVSGQVIDSLESILTTKDSMDQVMYTYRDKSSPDTTYNLQIIKNFKTDSILTFFGDNCYFVDKRSYKLKGKDLDVKKYLLATDIFDNQTALYFIDDYGLLIVKNTDWGNYSTFDKGLGFEDSILIRINGDTTDFF